MHESALVTTACVNTELYSMILVAMCVCCMQSGQPQDAKEDVKGKPESQKSKIARMFGQWFGKGTQMLADSGVIENDEANTAIGAAGTTIQEQAEMDPTETSASEFTPYSVWGSSTAYSSTHCYPH